MIRQPRPVYPKAAKQARVQGVVHLNIVVAKSGEVTEVHVLSGHPALVPAAVDAVRQWQYAPTYLNGEPVEIKTTVDVNFTLNQ
jgi:protein TonB